MKVRVAVCLAVAALIAGTSWAQKTETAEKKDPLEKATCMVSGKPVKAETAVEYKEGKVYFCCEGCPAAFKKDTEKFAAKANHQLVLTGQYKQEKCPISGRDVNKEKTLKVAELDVTFCCDNCLGKAKETKEAEQYALLFNEKSFEKAFKVVKEEEKKEAKASGS
jgi:hypothetical protein